METTVTFQSTSALFKPDECTSISRKFFGVAAEYDQKLATCSQDAARLAYDRMDRGEAHASCLHSVMRDFTRLVDERCPPSSAEELVHVFLIGGMITMYIAQQERIYQMQQATAQALANGKITMVTPDNPRGWPENAWFNDKGGVA